MRRLRRFSFAPFALPGDIYYNTRFRKTTCRFRASLWVGTIQSA